MTWGWRALALASGLLFTTAFAPRDFWWFALLCPAVLIWLWSRAPTAREGAWLGFAFGFGAYAAGTWWLYIAIRVFGQAPVWIALAVMAGLVLIMAGYQAGLGYVVVRWLPARRARGWLLLVPAAWVLLEWWRGWFLSGFPWMSLGYSQTDTWLAGLAPVGGVHLLSAVLLVGAGALVTLLRARGPLRAVAAGRTGAALDNRAFTAQCGVDEARRPGEIGGHPPGRRTPGHEMAGVEPADHPRRIRGPAPRRRWARTSSSGRSPRCRTWPTCTQSTSARSGPRLTAPDPVC